MLVNCFSFLNGQYLFLLFISYVLKQIVSSLLLIFSVLLRSGPTHTKIKLWLHSSRLKRHLRLTGWHFTLHWHFWKQSDSLFSFPSRFVKENCCWFIIVTFSAGNFQDHPGVLKVTSPTLLEAFEITVTFI